MALSEPVLALLVPIDAVPRQVSAGRYGAALTIAMLTALIAAFTMGARYDGGPAVLAELDKAASHVQGFDDKPPTEAKTDREIDEDIEHNRAVTRVVLGLKAGLGTPALFVALGIALFGLGKFVGGEPTLRRSMSVSALTFLPGSVRNLVAAAAAWRQDALVKSDFNSMVVNLSALFPNSDGVLYRLANSIDIFTLWALVMVGVGMSTSATISRRKSFLTIAVGFSLYILITRLVLGGPPVSGGTHQ